jgi:hypothetical protein
MSNYVPKIREARIRAKAGGQPAPMQLPRLPGRIIGLLSPNAFSHSTAAARNVSKALAGIAPQLARLDERILAEASSHLGESARARAEGRAQ